MTASVVGVTIGAIDAVGGVSLNQMQRLRAVEVRARLCGSESLTSLVGARLNGRSADPG